MARKTKVDNNTWMDFVVEVGLCGLCGNTGEINTAGVRSPIGSPVREVRGHCICPNGRAIKWAAKQYVQSLHTSPERVQSEAENAHEMDADGTPSKIVAQSWKLGDAPADGARCVQKDGWAWQFDGCQWRKVNQFACLSETVQRWCDRVNEASAYDGEDEVTP